ncbi:MAG TPA: prepilin-type N-terminal cleavage/methylation domain-containing protein [Gemmatimonadales bacterium]|nr:prepilin-type N-terminal cleavage/methylation domain-containing protein [Gemmatimonadales bacterium]
MTERGLTLLEVLVALVVLSLVALAYLQVFQGSHALVASSREWSEAIAYAEDAMERTKLGEGSALLSAPEALAHGFRRQVTSRPWQPGLTLVRVTVFLPGGGGGRFDLDRLARVDTARAGVAAQSPAVGQPW